MLVPSVSRRARGLLHLARALALPVLVLVASIVATPAGAQTIDPAAGPAVAVEDSLPELTLADLLPESRLFHPDVMAQVMPTSSRVESLRIELTIAMVDRDDADDRRLDALVRRSDARRERWAQRVVVAERIEAEETADAVAARVFEELGVFAVDSFVGSEVVDLARLSLQGPTSPLPGLTDGAGEVMEERYAAARADLAGARQARAAAEDLAAEIDARIEVAQDDLTRAEADLEDAEERIADLRPRLEQTLVDQLVPRTDLSLVVIDAYFRAAVSMADRRPSCGISWDQLAGVGLIESRHGSFGGSEVGPDGQTTKEILGPVLDGDPFAAIADTDGGALDGNTEWDRAVGPMQFIPSSWGIYGLDGNGDEIANPHNLYDAAYAAAEHLCRGHARLQNDANYRQSLFGYNRSAVYGSDVMAARSRYAAAVSLRPTAAGIAEDLARQDISAARTLGR